MPKDKDFTITEKFSIAFLLVFYICVLSLGFFFVVKEGLVFDDFQFKAFMIYLIAGLLFPLSVFADLIADFLTNDNLFFNIITLILTIITARTFWVISQGIVFDDVALTNFTNVSLKLIGASLVLIFLMYVFSKKKQEDNWFFTYVYKPEESIIYQMRDSMQGLWKIVKNPILLFLGCHLVFGILAFFSALLVPESAMPFFESYVFPVRPQSVFGIKGFEVFFKLFPSPAETGKLLFLISITASGIRWLFGEKLKVEKKMVTWLNFVIVGVLLSGVYWLGLHTFISQGSQFDMTGHFIFGAQSGMLTILTGQWIPALALHNANLFFWLLRDELTSRLLLRNGIISLLIVFSLSVSAYIYSKRRKKR